MDDSDSSETPEGGLIITIFHRDVPNSKTPEQDSPSEVALHQDLQSLCKTLHIPNLDSTWNHHLTSTHPTKAISRYILRLPHHQIPSSSLRHQPPISAFEHKHKSELIFDPTPTITPSGSRPLKLALFDMDSTLINEEVIDELARTIGLTSAVSAITARAMNGEIDFATSLTERVGMLKGVPTSVWEDLKKTVTIAEGARELVSGLRARGVVTGVVSGGFTPMAEWLKGELGLDVAVANHLVESPPTEEVPFPHLAGRLDPEFPLVTPELKRRTLLELSAKRSIALSQTLAVGDGSNDLLMLGAAGLGIAWRAKAKVQIAAPMRLNGSSLAELLHLLGPDESVDKS
ncbi:Phosphoserine phosphatase [Lecanora helva]